MSSGALSRQIRGETLLLHPERALSWPAHQLLVVADTHFGKSSLFARHGIAVPGGADCLDLDRLQFLLQSTRSERLLILGDFLHGIVIPGEGTALQLERWIRNLHPVRLLLVIGNHDRSAAAGWRAEPDWQGSWLDEGLSVSHIGSPRTRAGKYFLIDTFTGRGVAPRKGVAHPGSGAPRSLVLLRLAFHRRVPDRLEKMNASLPPSRSVVDLGTVWGPGVMEGRRPTMLRAYPRLM